MHMLQPVYCNLSLPAGMLWRLGGSKCAVKEAQLRACMLDSIRVPLGDTLQEVGPVLRFNEHEGPNGRWKVHDEALAALGERHGMAWLERCVWRRVA